MGLSLYISIPGKLSVIKNVLFLSTPGLKKKKKKKLEVACIHTNRNFPKLQMATKYVKNMLLSPVAGTRSLLSLKCKKIIKDHLFQSKIN